MRKGNQREQHRGHGCERCVMTSFPYLEQSHCRTSSVDRSVKMKSLCKSLVLSNRSAAGASSISGDEHERGAPPLLGHNMHGQHRQRKDGVGIGLCGKFVR